MRIQKLQHRLFTAVSAALFLAVLAPRVSHAQSFNLSVSAAEKNAAPFYSGVDSYALTWGAVVDPSSPTATVSYSVYRSFGLPPTVTPIANGVVVSTAVTSTSITLADTAGTLCWTVVAYDFESSDLGQSVTACHPYVNSTEDGSDGSILRVDGDGQQLGYNDIWDFTYFLDNDSFVTAAIYTSTANFTPDAYGFEEPSAGSSPIEVFEDTVPDAGNFSITDVWDTRDDVGNLVPNGIYYVYYRVTDVTGQLRFAGVYNVPVDLLRLLDFTTSGISPSGSGVADINFNVTEAATVRVVIAEPGTVMTEDSNGDVQAVNPANGQITTSTNVVVQTFTYDVPSGANVENWNGTDESGVPVSSGVYTVGISAVDAFGNHATDASGNYAVIQGVIPVNRTASQTPLPTTAPSITGIAVNGSAIALTGGSILTGSFNTIAITLSATAGTGSNLSQVTLSGPNGAIAGGSVGASGDVVTYSTGTLESSTGTYTINITAIDVYGNTSAPTSFNFSIALPTPPSVTSLAVNGSTIALTGGTIVSPPVSSVSVTLNEAGGTGVNQSVVTLLNPVGGSVAGTVGTAGDVVTFTPTVAPSTVGNYTITVVAKDVSGNASSSLGYSFTVPSPTPPSITGVAVGGSTISLAGGSIIAGSFNSIAITLNEQAGTGPNSSLVTLTGPNGSVPGTVSSLSNVVTFSTGTEVSSGTYTLSITAKDTNGDTASPASITFNLVPVTISFSAFSTSGITPNGPAANVNYTIGANATVRILIAQPGRQVVDDASGNVQSLNAAGTAVDATTVSVVQVFSVPVSAGANVTTWNGTNSSGVPVPAGLYTVGVSALDAFGDESTNLTGAVAPLSGTIAVNRTANQGSGNTTPPSVTLITVSGSTIALTGGALLTGSFSNVQVTLSATAGTGSNSSQVTLTGPNGAISGGTVSTSGNVVTFSTGTIQSALGNYTINVIAVDNNGNIAAPASYTFSLVSPAPPSVTAVSVNGSTISLLGGSSLSGAVASVAFTLNETGGTGPNSSVVTLAGPSGGSIAGTTSTSGNTVTFTLTASSAALGSYTASIIAKDVTGNASTLLTYGFILTAPPPPSITAVTISGSTLALSGTAIAGSFNSIAITLSAQAGTGIHQSSVTLTSPSNASIPGAETDSGNTVTFTPGTQTSTGTYTLAVTAEDISGNTAAPVTFTFLLTPVTIHFTAFSTTGLSPSSSQGTISYTISANATVRVLIAQPGRQLVDDTSGNVQSLNAAGTAIDTSTNSVVAIFTAPVSGGANSTNWSGNNSLGIAMPTGLYSVGISALDSFGDESTNLAGVVAPVTGTISLNRTGNQGSGNTTSPTVTLITVGGSTISLSGGSLLSSTFTAITATLSAAAGTGVNQSSATLTGPSGQVIVGTVTSLGNQVTFTAAAQSSTGTYTFNLIATDINGNSSAPMSFNFVIVPAGTASSGSGSGSGSGTGSSGSGSGSGGSGSGSGGASTTTAVGFSASLIPYPNPVKTAPSNISFNLPAPATVTIDIYTILGRRVFHTTQSYGAGPQSYPWALVNDASSLIANGVYLVKVSANTGSSSISAMTKIMVIR